MSLIKNWKKRTSVQSVVLYVAIISALGLLYVTRASGTCPITLFTSRAELDTTQSPSAATTGPTITAPGSATDGISWRPSFEAALQESAETGKPVLIDFMADWCPPCRRMEAQVWPDPDVQALFRDRVIPLQLDADEPDARPIGIRYGIQVLPTILLVDSSGQVIAQGNFMSAQEMVRFVEQNTKTANDAI